MFYKLMIALLVIGGLAPFTFIKGENGQPLMSFSDLKMPNSKIPDFSLPDFSDSDTESAPTSDGTVYKWKDKNGTWQFTSEPPPKDMTFTSTVYDQNMNVIQAVETKRTLEKKKVLEQTEEAPLTNLSAHSPEKIEKLFKDAGNLESLLNDRAKKQQEILDNL